MPDPIDSETIRRLCQRAEAAWRFDNGRPAGDLPSILAIASSPTHYAQRLVRHTLTQAGRRHRSN